MVLYGFLVNSGRELCLSTFPINWCQTQPLGSMYKKAATPGALALPSGKAVSVLRTILHALTMLSSEK